LLLMPSALDECTHRARAAEHRAPSANANARIGEARDIDIVARRRFCEQNLLEIRGERFVPVSDEASRNE